MPGTHAFRHAACAVAFAIALSATASTAAPTLDDARALYLGARYEESLAMLHQLHGDTIAEQNTIASYQVFCLIALARNDEADRTIDAIVAADPFYIPAEDVASPRIRDRFRQARRKALPSIVRREYSSAKLAFDRRDPQSSRMFERILALLADPDLDAPAAGDLRVLSEGFRDLSRSFASTLATPAGTPGATSQLREASAGRAEGSSPSDSPAASSRDSVGTSASTSSVAPPPRSVATTGVNTPAVRPAREGDPGVSAPVAISQPMPRWVPPAGTDRAREFDGIIEVLIDTRGSVVSATIRATIHPQYDPQLLQMARSWKFRPATRNGRAVAFTKLVEVRLKPAAR
jgi:hypothetical protein